MERRQINVIGFNGTMGAGKSEAIKLLSELGPNKPVRLIKFAGILYDIQEYIYKRISPVYPKPSGFVKDRTLLQWLGTEWGRSKDENLWVRLWLDQAHEALHRGELVVCDDVRFDNEAQMVKELGGIIVNISSNRTAERINTTDGLKAHKSEAGISENLIDYRIENNGTLDQYKDSLIKLYRTEGLVNDNIPTDSVGNIQKENQ